MKKNRDNKLIRCLAVVKIFIYYILIKLKFLKKLFWLCIWYIFIPHICIAHTGGQYAVNDICIILFQKIRLLKSYAQRQFIRINQLPKEQYNAPNHISYESNKKKPTENNLSFLSYLFSSLPAGTNPPPPPGISLATIYPLRWQCI